MIVERTSSRLVISLINMFIFCSEQKFLITLFKNNLFKIWIFSAERFERGVGDGLNIFLTLSEIDFYFAIFI